MGRKRLLKRRVYELSDSEDEWRGSAHTLNLYAIDQSDKEEDKVKKFENSIPPIDRRDLKFVVWHQPFWFGTNRHEHALSRDYPFTTYTFQGSYFHSNSISNSLDEAIVFFNDEMKRRARPEKDGQEDLYCFFTEFNTFDRKLDNEGMTLAFYEIIKKFATHSKYHDPEEIAFITACDKYNLYDSLHSEYSNLDYLEEKHVNRYSQLT